MSARIQKVLDGDLPPDALRPAEWPDLEAHEEAIDRALAAVRSERAPDVAPEVMRRIAALPRHGRSAAGAEPWRRALEWLWAPRPLAVRPAWALAAAAIAALLVLGPLAERSGPPDAGSGSGAQVGPAPAATGAGAVFVHFRLDAAEARSVQLAGDFTDWAPRYSLSQSAPGVWTVVVPVEPGVHRYAFIVDGERWVADPLAPPVDDGFGGRNSRLDVMPPEPRREL